MTEYDHQKAVFSWAKQPSVRSKHPELSLLFHIKNETKEGARQVAMDKAAGVKKGVPDLMLPVARKEYHGLFIEMKRAGGKVSADQEWWMEHLEGNCYRCCVCYGWQEAAEVLTWYLNLE